MAGDESESSQRIDELVGKFLSDIQDPGAAPAEIRQRLVDENPDIADRLNERLSVIEAVFNGPEQDTVPAKTVRTSLQEFDCPHCGNHVRIVEEPSLQATCESCGSVVATPSDKSARRNQPVPAFVGRFPIRKKLGQGGFGVAYLGRDPTLSRDVAIKTPHRGEALGRVERARFEREARAAARLNHPNIVKVFEVAVDDEAERPFIVSEYIEGMSLAHLLSRESISVKAAVEIAVQVAEAIECAHAQKIIHRDIKPSNILLDEDHKPYVTDFGLARDLEGDFTMTIDGELIGTPSYMSPEQALGDNKQVDHRADIYALGVLLYRMLCGVLPFQTKHKLLLEQIVTDEPTQPSQVNKRVPKDLNTIILKAMEKEPSLRYESAQDLADDLKLWQNNKPISASPISNLERLRRWRLRQPIVAGLTATALTLLLVVAITGVSWGYRESILRGERDAAKNERDQSRKRKLITKGQADLENQAYARSLIWFAAAGENDNLATRADRIRTAMIRGGMPYLPVLKNFDSTVADLVWRDDRLFVATRDGRVRAFNPNTDTEDSDVLKTEKYLTQLEMNSAGTRAATRLKNGETVIWNITTDTLVKRLPKDQPVADMAFQNNRLAVITAGSLVLYSADDGTEERLIPLKADKGRRLKFLNDTQLAAVSWDLESDTSYVQFFDVESGEQLFAETSRPGRVLNIAHDTENQRLLLSGTLGVDICSVQDGSIQRTMPFGGPVWESWPLKDENYLSLEQAGRLVVWNADGRELHERSLGSPVFSTSMAPSGETIAISGSDGSVSLLTTGELISVAPDLGTQRQTTHIQFLDERRVAVGTDGGILRIWDLAGITTARQGTFQDSPIQVVEFSPQGLHVANGDWKGMLRIREAASNKLVAEVQAHEGGVLDCVFNNSGKQIATCGADGICAVWDLEGNQIGESWAYDSVVRTATWSTVDENLLFCGMDDGNVVAHRVGKAESLFTVSMQSLVTTIKCLADGKRLVVGDLKGLVQVWNTDGTLVAGPFRHSLQLRDLSVSEEHNAIITSSDDGVVRVWKLDDASSPPTEIPTKGPATGAVMLRPGDLLFVTEQGHITRWNQAEARWVADRSGYHFLHTAIDDRHELALASGHRSNDPNSNSDGSGVVFLLDAETGDQVGPQIRYFGTVPGAHFAPNGTTLVTQSFDGSMRKLSLQEDTRDASIIAKDAAVLSGATLTDGDQLTVVTGDQLVRWHQDLRQKNPAAYQPSADQVAGHREYMDWMLNRRPIR